MAQHDYVIANASGAAVRSDINAALLAISSNNSGSAAPSGDQVYAYEWWVDTSNDLLKIRNSSNTAWITLRGLDGKVLGLDGTASAPGLTFTSDTDTGLYRPGTNQLGITTAGVERVNFTTTEAVFNNSGADYDFRVEGDSDGNLFHIDASADAIGVGIASPVKSKLHLRGSGQTSTLSDGGGADDIFRISSDGTTVGTGGSIAFANSQGDTAGSIGYAAIKGFLQNGSSNTKGSISFQTRTNVGDTALTEKMRVTANGEVFTYQFPSLSGTAVSGAIYTRGRGGLQGTSATAYGNPFNFYWTGSVLQAWVDTTNVGNVTLTSDYRTKREIATQTESGIDKVKQLRPVTFKRAEFGTLFQDEDVVREGFIAHEVGEVIPSGCEGEKDAENQIQSLNIDAIVSVLTKALQETIAKVETLETQNADLLARVTALEGS
jgi:hypothetical protein|tara:strand:+ start:362 stop:1666 length:1305 start_codon:yes stop_codon:yes gene_type:complete